MSASEISLAVAATPLPRIPEMSSGLGRLWSRGFSDASCFDRLFAKYPNMDSFSKAMVQIICDNQQTVIDQTKNIFLSNDGIKAISEALQSNTALQTFNLDAHCLQPDVDCYATLGSVLSTALKINRTLKNLSLGFVDSSTLSPTLGVEALLKNLPCYNLKTFDMTLYFGATDTLMQMFSDALQTTPYFPLESFTGTIQANPLLMGKAFGNTQCLTHLGSMVDIWPTGNPGVFAASAIGSSRIESYDFPYLNQAWTNQTELDMVLNAATKNVCFRNYTFPAQPAYPYPADFVSKLQTIVQNRLPCTPDPKCSVPVSCAGPTPPPTPTPDPSSPSSGMSIGTVLAIAIPSTAAVSVGLTLLVQRVLAKLRADDPMRRPLV